jgi:hypothetical protein
LEYGLEQEEPPEPSGIRQVDAVVAGLHEEVWKGGRMVCWLRIVKATPGLFSWSWGVYPMMKPVKVRKK